MSAEYVYPDLAKVPCLNYIRAYIAKSEMTDKNMTDISYHVDEHWLKVWFGASLSAADKDLLDGIVADSLGMRVIKKTREAIMAEILTLASVDPAQVGRLLDALDNYTSMAVALDNLNYSLARMRVQKVYADGAITEADMNLVLSCIPTSDYEEVPE